MEQGRIVEQGSYQSLLKDGEAFSRLISEFGTSEDATDKPSEGAEALIEEVVAGGKDANDGEQLEKKGAKYGEQGAAGAKLMQAEERETGSISWGVYSVSEIGPRRTPGVHDPDAASFCVPRLALFPSHGICRMGSFDLLPIWSFTGRSSRQQRFPRVLELSIYQRLHFRRTVHGVSAVCILWSQGRLLWTDNSIATFHDYMPLFADHSIYAGFGIAAGILTFIGTFLMYLRGISASYNLFNEALAGVMRSKVSWYAPHRLYSFQLIETSRSILSTNTSYIRFDTTPIGRIVSRLSKDMYVSLRNISPCCSFSYSSLRNFSPGHSAPPLTTSVRENSSAFTSDVSFYAQLELPDDGLISQLLMLFIVPMQWNQLLTLCLSVLGTVGLVFYT